MFASRLLRVLEAVPTDVMHDTRFGEQAKQDTTMKEDPITKLNNDSGIFGTEADPMSFESKNVLQLNGTEKDSHLLVFEVEGKHECWNPKFMDDLPSGDEFGTGEKESQNGLLHRWSSSGADRDSLSYIENDSETVPDCLEHECLLITKEDTPCNRSACRDSTNLYTNKDVSDFDMPELIVCYREVDHVVKDIGIDEGTPPSHSSLCKKFAERSDDLVGGPLLDSGKDVTSANEHGSRDKNSNQEDQNSPKQCVSESLTQKVEATFGATGKIAAAVLKEESFVDKKLPLQEFGTRSFLKSFLDSTDCEGIKATSPPDEQCPLGEVVSDCPASSSAEADGDQLKKLQYNSKVESGSITFNFSTNRRAETVRKKDTKEENNHCKEESHAPFPSGRGVNPKNTDNQAIENRSSVSQQLGKYDLGETSFSSAALVPGSDPVPFSGSISLRSDGSATSARSFAFPILQPEWDSSPVRMTDVDRRNFRKHKGWRSGLPCCHF